MSYSGARVTKGGEEINFITLGNSYESIVPAIEQATRHTQAMDKIHAWVCVRERTPKEVRRRLLECEYTPEEADEAVEAAIRCGLVSEERYASAFIRGKAHAHWGSARIRSSLRESGVGEEAISACEWLFPSEEEEYENAMAVCASKVARSKDPYATLMRRLIAKGFSSDLSHRVVNDFLGRQQA